MQHFNFNKGTEEAKPSVPGFIKIGAVYMAIIRATPKEYADEHIINLWEQYHAGGNANKKKALKEEHNALATKLNNQYGRKVYIQIW